MNDAERLALRGAMGRLADGDRTAFDEVFSAVGPLFRKFAAGMLGTQADAEDAAQEALTKVFANAHLYDPAREPMPWLLTFVANECRTLRQRARRRREGPEVEEVMDPRATPEHLAIHQELEVAVRETLAALRPDDVATILAALGEAQRPEIAPATFRKRLERSYARLREAWGVKHGL